MVSYQSINQPTNALKAWERGYIVLHIHVPIWEGTPKTEVKILDWAAHLSAIVLSSSQAPRESRYARLSHIVGALAGQIDA